MDAPAATANVPVEAKRKMGHGPPRHEGATETQRTHHAKRCEMPEGTKRGGLEIAWAFYGRYLCRFACCLRAFRRI